MNKNYDLNVNIDRSDSKYLSALSELLKKESLIQNAQILRSNDKFFGKYEKRVVIKFCGLSGLSLIGGTEKLSTQRNRVVKQFIDLISNKNNIVKELNDDYKTYLDVKLLFAYPYSDFMYDIIQAERTRQEGISINCQMEGKKYVYDFKTTQRLTYQTLNHSRSYQNLLNSLDKVQEAVNTSEEYINSAGSPNRVIVKFSPTNISACFLKINHTIFIDPYVFSKQDFHETQLALIAPISKISIPEIPENIDILTESERKIYEHYCSLVNHFRYLWYHPLTLYSTDATEYAKRENETLRNINLPKSISYLAKAEHLASIQGDKYSKADIDLWKQHCKNELLRYCSKFLGSTKDYQTGAQAPGKININPISIFIVGAWRNDAPSDYMNKIEDFINTKFASNNVKGLKLNPIKINAENGTEFHKLIFEGLNSSQLAIVVQTDDYEDAKNKFSRPNVYIEKGYLMGRLGKKFSRSLATENHEPVFVFIKKGANDGSDTNHITQTQFEDIWHFELQFFKIVKWLWEITELNSNYALEILRDYSTKFKSELNSTQNPERIQVLEDLSKLVQQFETQIVKWDNNYKDRMTKLAGQ
jgi:hypothetical protein